MSTLRTYSLDELKKMPKQDVIKLDMRQLPLPTKVLSYFHNRYNKLLERKKYFPDIEIEEETSSLYVFSFANVLLSPPLSGELGKGILDICNELGMKHQDIFSFNYHLSMSKEELLECTLENLCFAKNQVFWIVNGRTTTLGELLNINIEAKQLERCRNVGAIKLQEILTYILRMGFKMDSYPFLKSIYWKRICNEKCIKPGSAFKKYGVTNKYCITFRTNAGYIIPFEGSYNECIDWLRKNARKAISQ